jgi:hypothetical protein
MHIQFERTGGFAGMPLSVTIDTAALAADQNQSLQDAIAGARFFDLPAQLSAPSQIADQYHYRVTIEDQGRRHTVDADEAVASPAFQALLQQLTLLARTARRP